MNREDFAHEAALQGLYLQPRPRDPRPIEEKYDMGPPTDREIAAKAAAEKRRRNRVSISFSREELWELINGFGQSFESGGEGNELADKVSERLSDAYAKFLQKGSTDVES